MTEEQEHDYAYHQDKLLLLIARRGKLRANSDKIPKLDTEISAVKDLVRSYNILKAMELHRQEGATSLLQSESRFRIVGEYVERANKVISKHPKPLVSTISISPV